MGLDVISSLESKQHDYTNQISGLNRKIKECERAYESLLAFKNMVIRSQDNFHAINQSKNSVLGEIEGVKRNSRTAQKYHTGMQKIFSGFGSKLVGIVFVTLLSSIAVQLTAYTNKIIAYESDIDSYTNKIAKLDDQIKEAEKTKAVVDAVLKGGVV